MIISSALVFVWYLQTKQTTPPKEVPLDAALTQIKNKDITDSLNYAKNILMVK